MWMSFRSWPPAHPDKGCARKSRDIKTQPGKDPGGKSDFLMCSLFFIDEYDPVPDAMVLQVLRNADRPEDFSNGFPAEIPGIAPTPLAAAVLQVDIVHVGQAEGNVFEGGILEV